MVDDQTDFFDAKQKEQDSKSEINFQKNQLKFLRQKLRKSKATLLQQKAGLAQKTAKPKAGKDLEGIARLVQKTREGFGEKFDFLEKQRIKFLGLDHAKLQKYICWLYQDKEEPVLVTMVRRMNVIYVYKVRSDHWISFNLGRDPKMALNANSTFCHLGGNRLFCLTNNASLTNFVIDLQTNKYKVQPKTIMNNVYTACVHFLGQVFVVGALKNSECKALNESVECFDLKSSSWRLRSNLTFKRKKPVLRVIDAGALMAIGGKSSLNSMMPFPEVYSHAENSWTVLYMNISLHQSNVLVSERHSGKIVILGTKFLNNLAMFQSQKTVKLEFDCESRKFSQKDWNGQIDWGTFNLHTGNRLFQFDSRGALSTFDKFLRNRQLQTSNQRVTMSKASLIEAAYIEGMLFPQKMDIPESELGRPEQPAAPETNLSDLNFSFDHNSKLKLILNSASGEKEDIRFDLSGDSSRANEESLLSLADELIKSVDSMSLDKLLTNTPTGRDNCAFILDPLRPRNLVEGPFLGEPRLLLGPRPEQVIPMNFKMNLSNLSSVKFSGSSGPHKKAAAKCSPSSWAR